MAVNSIFHTNNLTSILTERNLVKDLVKECEKFAEESPYPEKSVMYDSVYEQEDYPFLPHKL